MEGVAQNFKSNEKGHNINRHLDPHGAWCNKPNCEGPDANHVYASQQEGDDIVTTHVNPGALFGSVLFPGSSFAEQI